MTHLFQILAFTAMEAPTSLEPAPISEEKNKVFRSLMPIDPANVVRGQYQGYRKEEGINRESDTETSHCPLNVPSTTGAGPGVPFFLRTGKRLAEGQRIISIAFREPPRSMFPAGSGIATQGPDHLTFDLADSSRMSLSFYGKRPGPGMALDKLAMQFAMRDTGYDGDVLEAIRALDSGCDARRSHAIQHRRGYRAPVGGFPHRCRKPRRRYDSIPRARGGRNAIHQLIAPRAWRLPFERAWRYSNENDLDHDLRRSEVGLTATAPRVRPRPPPIRSRSDGDRAARQ